MAAKVLQFKPRRKSKAKPKLKGDTDVKAAVTGMRALFTDAEIDEIKRSLDEN